MTIQQNVTMYINITISSIKSVASKTILHYCTGRAVVLASFTAKFLSLKKIHNLFLSLESAVTEYRDKQKIDFLVFPMILA
jgi:hypothetical protein